MDPKLHRGIRRAGYSGAHFGASNAHHKKRKGKAEQKIWQLHDNENFCRQKYTMCSRLHDSYRFPGISRRYMAATALSENSTPLSERLLNDTLLSEHLQPDGGTIDEYLAHEMKIFQSFQEKVNLHEIGKWLASANKRNI